MAFRMAEAFVELSERGFSTVSGRIDRMKSSMGGLTRVAGVAGPAIGAVGVAATGLAVTATAGAAAIGGFVGGMAALGAITVPIAARLEQTTAQFKTLLGSAELAKQKIQELQEFAATTPFQFDGLAQSAKTLLAFGVANEQVIPTMKVLGDVAAATGNQVGELANIYGKVKARGALMTEQLDQFNERGIPVGRKLAEMFGVTSEQLREMASDGQISFGQLQQALQAMTDEGGMAFNGMAEQAGTLSGLWSTFKDNIQLILADIGVAFVEGFELKDVVGNMTEFVQRVRSEWLPSIIEGFRWMSENIVQPVMAGIARIKDIVFDLVENFDLYWRYAYLYVANHVNNMYQRVMSFTQGVREVVASIYETWRSVFSAIWSTVSDVFSGLMQFLGATRESVTTWGGGVINVFIELVKNLDLYWKYAQVSLANTMLNMYEHVKAFFQNAVILGKWWFTTTGQIFTNLYNNAGEIFGNLIQQIKNNWTSLLDFFKTGRLEFDFSPITENFITAIEGIDMPSLVKPQLDSLKGELDRINNEILTRKERKTEGVDAFGEELQDIENQLDQRKKQREADQKKSQDAAHKQKMEDFKIEEGAIKKQEELKKKGGKDSAATGSPTSSAPSFSGLSQLADLMQQKLGSSKQERPREEQPIRNFGRGVEAPAGADFVRGAGAAVQQNMDARAQLDALRNQFNELKAIHDLATGRGLRVAMVGGGPVDPPDVKFGPRGRVT